MILACLQSGERICLLNLFLLRNSNGTFLWNAFYKKAYCLSSFQNYRLKMSNLCQLTSSSLRVWSYLINFHLTPTLGVKILFWIRPLTFINTPICEMWKKLPRWKSSETLLGFANHCIMLCLGVNAPGFGDGSIWGGKSTFQSQRNEW